MLALVGWLAGRRVESEFELRRLRGAEAGAAAGWCLGGVLGQDWFLVMVGFMIQPPQLSYAAG